MQVDQTLQQAEAIVRFTQEVDRRLAECGLSGAAELLALHGQLQEALRGLQETELAWASREVERLDQVLRTLGTELQHLSALKAAFDVPH